MLAIQNANIAAAIMVDHVSSIWGAVQLGNGLFNVTIMNHDARAAFLPYRPQQVVKPAP